MISFVEWLLKKVKENAASEAEVIGLLRQLAGTHEAEGRRLHPLLHRYASTPQALRFSSLLGPNDALIAGHILNDSPVLPGVACLEMAHAAWSLLTAPVRDEAASRVMLKNVVWLRPVVLASPLSINVELSVGEDGTAGFTFLGNSARDSEPYARGEACLAAGSYVVQRHNIDEIRNRCDLAIDATDCYQKIEAMGLRYGPSYRLLKSVETGSDDGGAGFAIARLCLADPGGPEDDQCVLHPGFLDAALQACIGLVIAKEQKSAHGSETAPAVPFALERLEVFGSTADSGWAYIRPSSAIGEASGSGLQRLDIDVCDDEGHVLVRFTGLAVRTVRDSAYLANEKVGGGGRQLQMLVESGCGRPDGSLERKLSIGNPPVVKRRIIG